MSKSTSLGFFTKPRYDLLYLKKQDINALQKIKKELKIPSLEKRRLKHDMVRIPQRREAGEGKSRW